MAKQDTHIHQYLRKILKTSTVYRCVLPGCRHYLRAFQIIGQIGKCWYCGRDFLITRDLARREKVHCANCTKGKKVKAEELVDFLTELGGNK